MQNKDFTKITELHATRWDGVQLELNTTVLVSHIPGLDVLKAIHECMTAWYKTEEGHAAWEYSCEDYNIGDWLCGTHPDDEFTSRYGFVLNPGTDHYVIEIDHDLVLGDGNIDEEDVEQC